MTRTKSLDRPKGQKHVLTDGFCKKAEHPESGQRLFFDGHPDAPAGFALRVTPKAKSWILNYYVSGKQRRLTLDKGYPAWGPKRARQEAAKVKTEIHAGADPLGEREAARLAKQAAAAEAERRAQFTVQALLETYVEHLRSAGKVSAREIEVALETHVLRPFPLLAAMPAADATRTDMLQVLGRLVKAGKYRTAEKVLAYLRAAYRAALRAEGDASMHAFAKFEITTNPMEGAFVSRTGQAAEKAAEAARERKWALSEQELAAYWKRLKADTTPTGAMLRLHLLTGGQRVRQLLRATEADYDADTQTLSLWDTKGRRGVAFQHVVPLLPDAVEALEAMRPEPAGEYLVTLDGGKSPATVDNLGEAMEAVATAMLEAGELSRRFTPGIIRKTVSTRLSAKGIPPHVRGRLQSNGKRTVQDEHYDAHDFLSEKREALELFRSLCEPQAKGKVIKFPAKAG